jgi:hypothetical protein
MALLKFSKFKKQRAKVKAEKIRENAHKVYSEAFKSKLAEFGVSSPIDLSEDDHVKFLDALKTIKQKSGLNENYSLNESNYGLDSDQVFKVMDIAAQYTSDATSVADVQWSNIDDLVKNILDYIDKKKYRKAFINSVKGHFPELTITESLNEEVKVGDRVKFEHGGKIKKGKIRSLDGQIANIDIGGGEIIPVRIGEIFESLNEDHLHPGSKVKDTEFTFEIKPFKSGYAEDADSFDFSIINIVTKSNWLNLDRIEGIGGLKLTKYDDEMTALFSVKHY